MLLGHLSSSLVQTFQVLTACSVDELVQQLREKPSSAPRASPRVEQQHHKHQSKSTRPISSYPSLLHHRDNDENVDDEEEHQHDDNDVDDDDEGFGLQALQPVKKHSTPREPADPNNPVRWMNSTCGLELF